MRRAGMILVALVAAAGFLNVPLAALQEPAGQPGLATCEEARIDKHSYRLTTEAQAMNVLRPREPWWEPYDVWQEPREIGNRNEAAARLAERARELDQNNLLAHGYLARHYVVLAVDANKAEEAWDRVLDSGGTITWTASLYEVDPRSFFVFAFDRKSIRIFPFVRFAGELRTQWGVPEYPGPEQADFWRALGGCLPSGAIPDAEIPWSSVREVRTTPSTLRIELHDRVEITSDRGRRRADDSLEVNLHGQAEPFDVRFGMNPFVRPPFSALPVGVNPRAYQERVKQFLEKFFLARTRS